MEKLSLLLKNKKSRNFFIYGIGQGFSLVSPLLVVPHIIKVCGEEGFGKVGLGFAMMLFLILIVDYAFEVKGTKEAAENRGNSKHLKFLFTQTIFSKAFLFIAVLAIAVAVIHGIPILREEKALYLLSLSVVFAQVFNPVWILQGLEDYTAISILNVLSKSLYVILVYVLVTAQEDYLYVNFYLGLSALIFNFAGIIILRLRHNITAVKPRIQQIITVLKADFFFCLSQLFLSVRQLSPIVVVGFFFGYYVAGQYKIIEQVISLFRTLIQVFLRYFYPIVCYKYVSEKLQGIGFWKKYSVTGFLLIAALSGAVFLLTHEILVFFNASQQTIQLLTPLLRLSLIICVLMAVSLPLEQLMFVTGNNKNYIRIAIGVTMVNVVLLPVLIKPYSIAGAIIALIAAEVLFIVLYYRNSYLHLTSKTN